MQLPMLGIAIDIFDVQCAYYSNIIYIRIAHARMLYAYNCIMHTDL